MFLGTLSLSLQCTRAAFPPCSKLLYINSTSAFTLDLLEPFEHPQKFNVLPHQEGEGEEFSAQNMFWIHQLYLPFFSWCNLVQSNMVTISECLWVCAKKDKKTKTPKWSIPWFSKKIHIILQRDFMESVSLFLRQHFVLLHFVTYKNTYRQYFTNFLTGNFEQRCL